MNATDIYNRMKISYAGNPEPIREIAKHTIVMQVEQFLQAPQEYKHVGDEIDDMFPRTGFQSEAGPEQLVQAALTCKCSAYEFPHRVAQGNCKQQPVSVMDELLSLTAIPGYKDAAIKALRAWAERILSLALSANGVKAYHQYIHALKWIEKVAHAERIKLKLKTPSEREIFARMAIEELYLSQTVSDPSEWWVDGYTREVDPDAQGELDTNRTAQKFLADEKASIQSGNFTVNGVEMTVDATKSFKEDPILEAYLAIYPPDQAREMARQARNTMMSPLGDEEVFSDFEGDDDRGFVPPPLVKDFNPNMMAIDWTAANAFRLFKKSCWDQARKAFPNKPRKFAMNNIIREAQKNEVARLWNAEKYTPTKPVWDDEPIITLVTRQEYHPESDDGPEWVSTHVDTMYLIKNTVRVRDDLIAYASKLAQDGDNPYELSGSSLQAASLMITPFLDDEPDAEEELAIDLYPLCAYPMTLEEYNRSLPEVKQQSVLDGINIYPRELSDDLLECIALYEQEIIERSDKMTKSNGENPVEVDQYSKRYIDALTNTLPVHESPERSRAFVTAHIAAVSSGANDETATATAWASWRQAMSANGAKNYDAVLILGGKTNMAWKAFWSQCSVNIPRPKSSIISASQAGLKIVPAKPTFKPLKPLMLDGVEIAAPVGFEVETKKPEVREINWGIAVNKMRAGEFDLSNKKAILALKAKGWREADYFLRLVERT